MLYRENEATEQKYIVFDSCLRQLFSHCRCCGGCKVSTTSIGSMVNIIAKCSCGLFTNGAVNLLTVKCHLGIRSFLEEMADVIHQDIVLSMAPTVAWIWIKI